MTDGATRIRHAAPTAATSSPTVASPTVTRCAFAVLGAALAPWLARFEATVLVVGGSMAGSWDLVRPPLLAALRRTEPALAGLAVRRAAHPEDSALIGAAVHAWRVSGADVGGS